MTNELEHDSLVVLGKKQYQIARVTVARAPYQVRSDLVSTTVDLVSGFTQNTDPESRQLAETTIGNMFHSLDSESSFLVFDRSVESSAEKPVGGILTYVKDSEFVTGEQVLWMPYWGVLPDYRRNGLGTVLLRRVVDEAVERKLAIECVSETRITDKLAHSRNGKRFLKDRDLVLKRNGLRTRLTPRSLIKT